MPDPTIFRAAGRLLLLCCLFMPGLGFAGAGSAPCQCPQKTDAPPLVQSSSPLDTFIRTGTPGFHLEAEIWHARASDIQVKVNGSAAPFDFARCKLDARLHLRIGHSTIELEVRNAHGSVYRHWYVSCGAPDSTRLPEIEILKPEQSGDSTRERIYTTRALLYNIDKPEQIQVNLNGLAYPQFEFKARENSLRADLPLQRGLNHIEIIASNATGRSREWREISLEEKDLPPSITQLKPERVTNTFYPVSLLELSTRHIRSEDQIEVWINGRSTRTFLFDYKNELIRIQVPLQIGNNGVQVKVHNSMGTAALLSKINYDPSLAPTQAPIITPLGPTRYYTPPDGKNCAGTFDLRILYIDQASQVQLYLNGTELAGASFDALHHIVSIDAELRLGPNFLRIVAFNQKGKEEITLAVNCVRPW